MIRNLILLFFLFITSFSFCDTTSKINDNSTDKLIYLSLSFNKKIKINDKKILFDLTSDLKSFFKKNDTTTDLLKSGQFIYKNEDILKYAEYKAFIADRIKVNLKKNSDFNFIIRDTIENINSGILVDLSILEYTEGEYNLIRNRNSIIKLLVKINKKDSKNDLFLIEVNNYFCKSDLDFPTESIRLAFISDKISNNIIKKISKYYNDKQIDLRRKK